MSTDPHTETLEVYETRAAEWARRTERRQTEAREFAALVQAEGVERLGAVVDLGCGPGVHTALLGNGAVAMDAAGAMLSLAARAHPHSPLLQADLRMLPFARHSMGAAWANKSYVHLERSLVPMALWDLHRAIAPGGLAALGVFAGDQEHSSFDDDDFGGRHFSLWPQPLLRDVLRGAGFAIESFVEEETENGEAPYVFTTMRRERTIADTVGPNMSLLLVGLNPSLHAVDSGVGFSGPSNRGWPALLAAGLATRDRDPVALLRDHRTGMTDLVKRATARAVELDPAEYRQGLDRLERLCRWLRPSAVCVIGLTGWRRAVDRSAAEGLQPRELGGRPVWLMQNPSGLNAHVSTEDLARSLRAAAALAARAG